MWGGGGKIFHYLVMPIGMFSILLTRPTNKIDGYFFGCQGGAAGARSLISAADAAACGSSREAAAAKNERRLLPLDSARRPGRVGEARSRPALPSNWFRVSCVHRKNDSAAD
jgi:hypothetical protein